MRDATTLARGGTLARRALLVVAAAVMLAACTSDRPLTSPSAPAPSPDPDASRSSFTASPSAPASAASSMGELHIPPAVVADEVPLMCGSPLVFSVRALSGLPGAELANHPAAASLRQLIATGPPPPAAGWRTVVLTPEGALFVVEAQPGEWSGFWSVEVAPEDSDWRPVRWGQCDIQPAFEGVEAARWELVPGQGLSPETEVIEVEVHEQACASGASPAGRISGPAVVPLDDAIIVILGTRPPPGPQTCVPGPSATVRVELPEPLGDRQLLDGATFPAEPRS